MGYYAKGYGFLDFNKVTSEQNYQIILDTVNDAFRAMDEGWGYDVDGTFGVSVYFDSKWLWEFGDGKGVKHELMNLWPLVEPGQYIQFTGEDNEIWRVYFTNKGVIQVSPEWPVVDLDDAD